MQIAEQPAIGVEKKFFFFFFFFFFFLKKKKKKNPDGVCFVIAAAPFLGYPIVETIVQPSSTSTTSRKPAARTRPSSAGRGRFRSAASRATRRTGVSSRRSSRRCSPGSPPGGPVVFLSGDVHYGFTIKMGYWLLGKDWVPRTATRVIQPTASSFREQRDDLAPLIAIDLAQQLGGLATSQPRLGWHRGLPAPRRRAAAPGGLQVLQPAPPAAPGTEDPIVVSSAGIPATDEFLRDPEWAW